VSAYLGRVTLDVEDLLPPILLDVKVCAPVGVGWVVHGRRLGDDLQRMDSVLGSIMSACRASCGHA
jgi:hypothetical protein